MNKRLAQLLLPILLALPAFAAQDVTKDKLGVGIVWGSLEYYYAPSAVDIRYKTTRLGIESSLLGLNVDFFMAQKEIFEMFGLYMGLGVHGDINGQIDIGARIPVGINYFLGSSFELFLEVIPTYGIIGTSGLYGSTGLGFHYYF